MSEINRCEDLPKTLPETHDPNVIDFDMYGAPCRIFVNTGYVYHCGQIIGKGKVTDKIELISMNELGKRIWLRYRGKKWED